MMKNLNQKQFIRSIQEVLGRLRICGGQFKVPHYPPVDASQVRDVRDQSDYAVLTISIDPCKTGGRE